MKNNICSVSLWMKEFFSVMSHWERVFVDQRGEGTSGKRETKFQFLCMKRRGFEGIVSFLFSVELL